MTEARFVTEIPDRSAVCMVNRYIGCEKADAWKRCSECRKTTFGRL